MDELDRNLLSDDALNDIDGGTGGALLYPYVIQRGDTLIRIAERFGTTVAFLVKVNHIQNASKIYAGDTIYVPHNK